MILLYHTIKSIIYIIYCRVAKPNRKIIPEGEGKTLRILGNGQSLANEALNKNVSYEYMVVNRHVLADNYTLLKPQYYVLADSHFFEHPEGISVVNKIVEKTTWNMVLFMPNNKKAKRQKVGSNGNILIKYFNENMFKGYKAIEYWAYDHQLAMPRVQNVMVAAIMLGVYMKYSKIELYGVEHSWTKYLTVGDDNLVYLDNPHFYDKEVQPPKPFKDIQHTNDFPMWHVLECYMYMFKSYSIISDYITNKGIRTLIINKTPRSFIDAFKRG